MKRTHLFIEMINIFTNMMNIFIIPQLVALNQYFTEFIYSMGENFLL